MRSICFVSIPIKCRLTLVSSIVEYMYNVDVK
jgi:hypothetical protein